MLETALDHTVTPHNISYNLYCVVPLFLHPVHGRVIMPNSHINLGNLNMRAHASVCAHTHVAQGEALSVWYLILPFLHKKYLNLQIPERGKCGKGPSAGTIAYLWRAPTVLCVKNITKSHEERSLFGGML